MNVIPVGPFDLHRVLGKGGMAVVWRGVHRTSKMPVAVKIMTGKLANLPHYQEGFFEEIRSVARFNHPSVLSVLDAGPLSEESASVLELPAGSPYLVMELIVPGPLSRYRPPSKWVVVQTLLKQILDGLAHAHARGVIHRDIKGDNILIAGSYEDEGWQAKLADFGLARTLDGPGHLAENKERISGTPSYMSPEQILGEWRNHGPWTDLYAMGCLAWALVCGQPPFGRGKPTDILRAHLYHDPPQFEPGFDVPRELEEWLRRLLAKNAHQRFQRAADASWALGAMGAPIAYSRITSSTGFPVFSSTTSPSSEHALDPGQETTQFGDTTIIDRHVKIEDTTRFDGEVGLDSISVAGAPSIAPFERDEGREVRAAALAPMPSSWRGALESSAPALVGAGLGLYGLRVLPLVDRVRERDLIWESLRRARKNRNVQIVIIKGPSGTGKSRLAQWVCERAEETGAATHIRVVHSARRGPSDGLAAALAKRFACLGLSRQDITRRIVSDLAGRGISDETAYYDAVTLAQMVADDGDALALSASERYLAMVSLIERLARERPVILWLDDVQWSSEALATAHALARRATTGPVLVLMTVREEACDEEVENALDELAQDQSVEAMALEPLRKDDHEELVRSLLGLDEALVAQVARRTMGNPLFAVQLVADWVERGILEAGQGGFHLAKGQRAPIPDDVHEVCSQRLSWALGRVNTGLADGRRALEVAAALGQHIDIKEWTEVCQDLSIAIPYDLIGVLANGGLIFQDRGAWSFIHGMYAESIEREARDAGRGPRIHAACARVIQALYGSERRGVAARRARHLLEAREIEAALAPLIEAARQALLGGLPKEALRWLGMHTSTLDSLGRPQDHADRIENMIIEARSIGELGGAKVSELADRAVALATHHGKDALLANALRLRAQTAVIHGEKLEFARDCLERAREAVLRTQDERLLAEISGYAGYVLSSLGLHEEARRETNAALAIFEAREDLDQVGKILTVAAQNAIHTGHLETARTHLKRASDIAAKTGNRHRQAFASVLLGDLERERGELNKAGRYYVRSEALLRSANHPNRHVARLKMVWLDFAMGRYQASQPVLEELLETLPAVGRGYALPYVRLGLCVCAADAKNWPMWDEHFDNAITELEASGELHRDLAHPAQIAGDLAAGAGQPDRASRAFEFARRQRDGLSR
ncbi:MAG: serine/threonine-protein kinase PknK [Bradymonadaceae bacterium]